MITINSPSVQIADFIMQRTGSTGNTLGPAAPAPAPPLPVKRKASIYFPLQQFVLFKDVVADLKTKVMTKVSAMIANASDGGGTPSPSPDELDSLASLLDTLSQTSRYHASTISGGQLAGVLYLALKWTNNDCLFPCYDGERLNCVLV